MSIEEVIKEIVESEGREEYYGMLVTTDESDSEICYIDITLSQEDREKLRRLYTKYGLLYFCNHLEEEFSSEELEILLKGENPKDVESIFFEEPCYLILHGFDESEPVNVGYLTYEENYFAHDVIRLSKADYIKLLDLLISQGLAIKDFKFKDLERLNKEFFNNLKKQRKIIGLPEENSFEDSEFISWSQILQRANQLRDFVKMRGITSDSDSQPSWS